MGALVTGAAVAVVSTAVVVAGAAVVVAGATVAVLGAALVELGAAGTRQVCQQALNMNNKPLICREHWNKTTVAWSQGTHLQSLSQEDVFCLRWHPALR